MKKLVLICFFTFVTFFVQAQSERDLDAGNVSVPSYSAGDWRPELSGCPYLQDIKFNDGTKGRIFKDCKDRLYLIDVFKKNYYKSYSDVVKALFIYKKHTRITDAGRE